MYDIRQFKPTLYIVLLLGLTGFSMAAEAPFLWAFAFIGLCVNAWLVYTGRFAPLPRWLANLATILALLYTISEIRSAGGPPLMFIGQFLVLLQLVKLYEQRANRDYAQLLVLSLLLMIAASINTASLLFGVVMIVYLIISLYCCLLFHLKAEADRARTAFPVPDDQVSPAMLRQDQRYLPRSMRRLTALVSTVAIIMAVGVFLFFPRGAGQGVLGQLQFRPSSALTGFSDRVSFEQIARIQQNDEVVAQVSVWRDGQRVEGTETLMLRGLTLDTYVRDPARSDRSQWTRSRSRSDERELVGDSMSQGDLAPEGEVWRQRVLLRGTGSRFLFALPGLLFFHSERERQLAFRANRPVTVRYSPTDESLQTEPVILPLEYEILSTNSPRKPDFVSALFNQITMAGPSSEPAVLEQVRQYALRPDVAGSLAGERSPLRPIDASNEPVAAAIESHLRSNFTYTLDLTDARDRLANQDPIVAFLNTLKRGHCEYFASAMALMCQSLGIPARVVIGFKCDEYNGVGGYYIVRQAHAHAWVEVATPRGWIAFDPTSGREAPTSRTAGLWRSIKHFLDFLEYKWAENIVAYNTVDRDNLIRNLDTAATNVAIESGNWLVRLRDWIGSVAFWNAWQKLLSLVMALMVGAVILAIVSYLILQHRLRRRALRIGLDTLPRDEQIRLARQLAFYDQLTQILHRHQIVRPPHLTPLEFAASLVFLPAQAYEKIRRLTHLLYRVRFGQAQLTPARQHHLEQTVERLAESFDSLPPARPV